MKTAWCLLGGANCRDRGNQRKYRN